MPEDVPIALFIFNRPDLTKLTIEQLSKSKPPLLYVFADGPRNKDEEILCNSAREVALLISARLGHKCLSVMASTTAVLRLALFSPAWLVEK